MQQRTDQLSLSGEVEGYRTSEWRPSPPRDQRQGEVQRLDRNTGIRRLSHQTTAPCIISMYVRPMGEFQSIHFKLFEGPMEIG